MNLDTRERRNLYKDGVVIDDGWSTLIVLDISRLSLVSWNVNSVYTKLEKSNVQQLLLGFDAICLCEVKTCVPVCFPG